MKSTASTLNRLRALAMSAIVGCGFPGVAADTFKPGSDGAVVETLRTGPLSAADRQLRLLRERVRTNAVDRGAAMDLARALIRKCRAESDPRMLSQAQVALAPWISGERVSADALVLEATIRQSLHDFDGALQRLDAALRLDPQNVQAWLTKATVHTVRAEYAPARQACLTLARWADELTAVTATTQVGALTGSARTAEALLRRTLTAARKSGQPIPADRLVWAHTLLGEIAARLGDAQAAEADFRKALALSPEDPYLLGAYADFLLDERRPEEVIDLLYKYPRIDALLLRVAEAGAAVAQPDASMVRAQVRELAARFDAAQLRGDAVHRREEARFRLRLLRDAKGALALARENWRVQKEPADARILLEAARAAAADKVVGEVMDWVASTKLEDRALTAQGPR